MTNRVEKKLDLVVIGSGLAGTAATCFATARGLSVVQVSATSGELAFASGLLDLLEVYPLDEKKHWDNPWEGLEALIAGSPRHPFAKIGIERIRKAIEKFTRFAAEAGFPYRGYADRNVRIPTAAGTVKPTFRVPESMWWGALALDRRLPALVIDFEGMKDFNAKLMAEMLRRQWPLLRAKRFPFPSKLTGDDRSVPVLADAMETAATVRGIADLVAPHIEGCQALGVPAILGIRSTAAIIAALEERLGVHVFEIPTMPPAITGFRMREAFEKSLTELGAEILRGRLALSARIDDGKCTGIVTGRNEWRETFEPEGVILATGRFLGGGLTAGRTEIRENLFGLPVAQPKDRESWHRENFLDERGHPANEAGIEIDSDFRPLGPDGRAAFENVFAAGSILAHQNWVRTKSGGGLAVATAYAAVEAFLKARGESGR
ncbi:MAG: glycerol-3-phosphate dehydrogenase subunit GlpB [Desulfobacteraceae bacterium]|nr:glycerol-3-phosphate dehydrogenase subunit GlpB [Desulfobacteraceae bacterium]